MAWLRVSLVMWATAICLAYPMPALAEQALAFRTIEIAAAGEFPDDACCDALMARAVSESMSRLRFGYGDAAKWVKLEGVPGEGVVRLSPVIDRITLYTRSRTDGAWTFARAGDLISASERAMQTPFMAFPLPASADVNAVYARLEQGAAVSISADHWSAAEFASMQEGDRTIKTFLIGFICSIILYNLVMSVLVADPAFAANALTILSMCVCSIYLSGYGVVYVWPAWHAASNWIFFAACAASMCFGALFMLLFLKQSERPAPAFWPFAIAPAAALVCLAASAIAGIGPGMLELAILLCAAASLLIMLVLVARLAISGDERARILMLPLMFAVIPGITMVALNKIVGMDLFGLGNNYMEVTLATEALLFSLALASRIRIAETAAGLAAAELLDARARSAATVLAAQDNERKRLATELHDNIGQELLVVVGRMKQLASRRPDSPSAGIFGEELVARLSAVLNELRRITRDMHPASIEHLGLAATIRGAVEQFQKAGRTAYAANIAMREEEIAPQDQIHILRIVQECLSNVARHAGASHCHLEITHTDEAIRIVVEDDGVGMPETTANAANPPGLGMISIDERVRSLAGAWTATACEQGGTRIRISIPAPGLREAGGEPG